MRFANVELLQREVCEWSPNACAELIAAQRQHVQTAAKEMIANLPLLGDLSRLLALQVHTSTV